MELVLYPVAAGVHVQRVVAEKADEAHAAGIRELDGEARGSRDGSDERDARHESLLHDLEARAPAHHENVSAQRHVAGEKRRTYYFVHGVVAADVLSDKEEVSLSVEESGRVDAAGLVEACLLGPHLVG